MLMVVFMFLAAVSIGLIATTGLLLWLQVWLLAILRLSEGKFVRAGLWLCLAMLPFSVVVRESFVPLFVMIMLAAVGAAIWKSHSTSSRTRFGSSSKCWPWPKSLCF
jgi:hypothetical protein